MPEKINKLSEFEAMEISLVTEGANLKKRFPITKEKNKMDFEEILEAVVKARGEGEDKLDEICKAEKVSEKGVLALKAAFRILNAFRDELPANVAKAANPFMIDEDEDEETDEEKKEREAKEAKAKAAKEKEKEDKLKKSIEKDYKIVLKEQADRLEVVQKKLDQVEDERALEMWTNKSRTDLSHFPGKSAEELGLIFKSFNKIDPKMAEEQFIIYKASSEAMKTSGLLNNAGTSNSGVATSSAEEKIEKKVKQVIEKSSKELTYEQAYTKVLDMHPELYEEYLIEIE